MKSVIHLMIFISILGALMTQSLFAAVAGESDNVESALQSRSDLVFYGGFETDIPGTGDWRSIWASPWSAPNRSSELSTVTGADAISGNMALRVDYPAGGVGPSETGTQWPIRFADFNGTIPATYDSLYLRYYVYFEDGFDFVKGGKLPGFMGGGDSWSRSGGNQPDGTNGWTMRFMWRTGGAAVVYAYLPPGKYKEGDWGTDISLNRNFTMGKWICIEQFIKVNTIGQEDGKLHVWFDGEKVLDLNDVLYRTAENDAGKIGGIYFSTFHGGNTDDWAPSVTSYARFDGFAAGYNRIGLHGEPSTFLLNPEGGHAGIYNLQNIEWTQTDNRLIASTPMGGNLPNLELVVTAVDAAGKKFHLPRSGESYELKGIPPGVYRLLLELKGPAGQVHSWWKNAIVKV